MNLCVSAPEIQHKATCTTASDMYSLGMVFIACFNSGHSVIQASHSTQQYFKLAGQVRDQCQFWTDLDIYSQLSERVNSVLAKIPIGIQESVFHLVNQETKHRPTAKSLVQISYFGWDYDKIRVCKWEVQFRDPAVQALQFLESLNSKDTNQKAQFFRNSLLEVFSIIPRVNLINNKLTQILIFYS